MEAVLLVDFGSTYTKLTVVDVKNEEILATAKSPSTVETDIMIGLQKAYSSLKERLRGIPVEFTEKYACSSAAGGLKIVALGLVPELTVEAAARAALGAGARIVGTYNHEIGMYEVEEIIAKKPDIILLAGGTDGGNKSCILHNAKMLAEYLSDISVIAAGNSKAREELEKLFSDHKMCYRFTENVMPRLNILNVEPVRQTIRKLFIERIVLARGLKRAEKYVGKILMPTPAAVMQAAAILADGTAEEEGYGELMVVDIGGATTDVHSIASGEPLEAGISWYGLPEPYAKRTVEGDLGMRVSAYSLWQTAGYQRIRKYYTGSNSDIEQKCLLLSEQIDRIPVNDDDFEFDAALGAVAAQIAVERHAGMLERHYTPTGLVYALQGKDLRGVSCLIGTGGVLVKGRDPQRILQATLEGGFGEGRLIPQKPQLMLDSSYILSAMGLLSNAYPVQALRIMKKYLKRIV